MNLEIPKKTSARNLSCSIYVIAIEGSYHLKIGISADPQGRLAQLQTAQSYKLRLAHCRNFDSRDMALACEKDIHKAFSKHRLSGEWFDVSLEEAVKEIANWEGFPKRKPIRVSRHEQMPEGFHPEIPSCLKGLGTADMTPQQRLSYWSCFQLGKPPEGFDDWYIIGNPRIGVIGAFPVEGFMT